MKVALLQDLAASEHYTSQDMILNLKAQVLCLKVPTVKAKGLGFKVWFKCQGLGSGFWDHCSESSVHA